MSVHSSARDKAARIAPAVPSLPALRAAALPDDGFEDEKNVRGLEYIGLDLAEQSSVAADIDQCRFETVTMPASLRRVTILGSEFNGCDMANLHADEGSLFRSAINSSRLTGLSWTSGTWRDVTIESSRANLAFFGHSKLHSVVFRDCELTHADFERVKFRNVLFERCDLSGAQFSGATMVNVRVADCTLANLRGVNDLRGATVKGGDLLGLTGSLAREAGIAIEW